MAKLLIATLLVAVAQDVMANSPVLRQDGDGDRPLEPGKVKYITDGSAMRMYSILRFIVF